MQYHKSNTKHETSTMDLRLKRGDTLQLKYNLLAHKVAQKSRRLIHPLITYTFFLKHGMIEI